MSEKKNKRVVHSAPYTFSNGETQRLSSSGSEADIPASLHALDFAYKDLKKRYNELNQKNSLLMKQLRQNSQPESMKNEFVADGCIPTQKAQSSCSHKAGAMARFLQDSDSVKASQLEEKNVKLQQDYIALRCSLVEMTKKQAETEAHNEQLMKDLFMMKKKYKCMEEERDNALRKAHQLTQQISSLEQRNNTLMSHLKAGGKEVGGPVSCTSNTKMAEGLKQLFQVVGQQREEMAALRKLADKQRQAIQTLMLESDMHEYDLDLGRRDASMPTQCTDAENEDCVFTPSGAFINHSHVLIPVDKDRELNLEMLNESDIVTDNHWSMAVSTNTARKVPITIDGEVTRRKQPVEHDLARTCAKEVEVMGCGLISRSSEITPSCNDHSLTEDCDDLQSGSLPTYTVAITQGTSSQNNARDSYTSSQRPLNYERNLEPAHPDNTNPRTNVNLHTEPSGATAGIGVPVLNNDPLVGHKLIPQRNLYVADAAAKAVGPPSWTLPRERADGSLDLQPQVCPVCQAEFSPPLSMNEFETHVFDCLPREENGESASGTRHDSSERVCPMCNESFPADISQTDFLHHVDGHFEPDFDIVESVP